MRHAAAATALAVALALAAPAQASGRAPWASPADFVQTLRVWIAGLWEGLGRADRPASQPVWEKAGGCVDPLGRPISSCDNQSTAGGTADPDGR